MPLCNICGETSSQVEEGAVRSNVRKFGTTQFRLWRCPKCYSVHATDECDLAEAYRDYPYHKVGKQSGTRFIVDSGYRNLLRWLRKAGLRKEHKMLDYGCGGAEFLRFLRRKGYDIVGYDEYTPEFSDTSVLNAKYDFVLSQDVIEHVAEPWEHLRTLANLVAPGGYVAIGTPNAEIFDLKNPAIYVHALHQPYHRHILSKRALFSVGEKLGWQLVQSHAKMYANTLMPFSNGHFFAHFAQTGDNTLDYVMEPIKLNTWKLYTLKGLYYALFGYFHTPEDNLMAIYRAGQTPTLPRNAEAAQ